MWEIRNIYGDLVQKNLTICEMQRFKDMNKGKGYTYKLQGAYPKIKNLIKKWTDKNY
tara:strand:- start:260 stop:430 length:171 start_codon:yes stop_codon:yes gene_type:complete